MPKIINHEEIRHGIIEKAIPLFATEGYAGVNFTMLSAASGVRRTSLYKFFNDKEDLFLKAIDHAFQLLETATKPIISDTTLNGWEKTQKLCFTLLKSGLASRNAMMIILQTAFFMNKNELFSGNIRRHADYLRGVFAAVLRQGIQGGQLKAHDPENMAFAIVAIIEAFIMQDYLNKLDDSKVEESLNILLSGIKTNGPGSSISA